MYSLLIIPFVIILLYELHFTFCFINTFYLCNFHTLFVTMTLVGSRSWFEINKLNKLKIEIPRISGYLDTSISPPLFLVYSGLTFTPNVVHSFGHLFISVTNLGFLITREPIEDFVLIFHCIFGSMVRWISTTLLIPSSSGHDQRQPSFFIRMDGDLLFCHLIKELALEH